MPRSLTCLAKIARTLSETLPIGAFVRPVHEQSQRTYSSYTSPSHGLANIPSLAAPNRTCRPQVPARLSSSLASSAAANAREPHSATHHRQSKACNLGPPLPLIFWKTLADHLPNPAAYLVVSQPLYLSQPPCVCLQSRAPAIVNVHRR